jgi:2-polyprenyl-6-methoxyphenol hydroxylase-like FAD-dependent oxidoreductase
MRHVPVLIVGGGPVGLALAAELGWRSVPCELLEQTDGAIATPKMNEVNIRTMEICRRWGAADAVLNCPFPADFPLDVAFVTKLFGYEMGRVVRPARKGQTPEAYSPYRLQACSQTWFDPILQGLARHFPDVRLRYRTRLDSFEQNADGVVANVVHDVEGGAKETLIADYLVGCDGANSFVRHALGLTLEGQGTLSQPLHMFFRAPDLLARSGQKPATFFLLIDKDGFWGNLRIIDPANGIWRLMVDASDGNVPDEKARDALLKRALGREERVEWLGASVWKRKSVVASSFSQGRVFIAGDAAHQLSPTGALGMNSGIADAVDLGWKLAATLQGWGGPRLMGSYDAERRPIGLRNVRMATEFFLNAEAFAEIGAIIEQRDEAGAHARAQLGHLLVDQLGREFRTVGLQLGYRYADSPILAHDEGAPPPDLPDTYTPSTFPGARAPHAWLEEGWSTLDLFGKEFVLMCFHRTGRAATLVRAAAAHNVPLSVFQIEDAPEIAALYEKPLVLVRPDGHVAWRGDALPANLPALIDKIRGA